MSEQDHIDPDPAAHAESRSPFVWLLLANSLIACACFAGLLLTENPRYARYPVDAYYYLDMAAQFAGHGVPSVRFQQGVPVHFFPGYPILLGTLSLASSPQVVWLWLQLALGLGIAILLFILLRKAGQSAFVSLGVATLLVTNSVFVRWTGLPCSETTAIFLGLAAAASYQWARTGGTARWLAPGVLTGLAGITRPEALYLLPSLVAFELFGVSKRRMTLKAFVAFALPAVLPAAVYFILMKVHTGTATPYAQEYMDERGQASAPEVFFDLVGKLFRIPHLLPSSLFVNSTLIAQQLLFYFAAFTAMRGYAGRGLATVCWLLLGYFVLHSFWYYSSERFNMLALPAAIVVFTLGLAYLADRSRPDGSLRGLAGAVFAGAVILFTWNQLAYSRISIHEHQEALGKGAGRPRDLAALANELPTEAWSEAGVEFAYHFEGHTYMDFDQPYFVRRTEPSASRYFATHDVQWVVSRETPERWFARHNDLSSSTISLKRQADDGVFTLYRVTRTAGNPP